METSSPMVEPAPAAPTPNAAPTAPAQAATPAAPAASRPRVLIVDDEEGILSSLRRLLRKEPYEVTTTANAKEAIQILETQPVSLVISDYRMPGMTGTELLLEVQRRWPETVRIVLSGYSEVKAIISAINEGAVYKFISKPWNDEEIKLHVRRALEQHALQAENRRLTLEISQQNQRLRELNEQLDQRATDASLGLGFAQEVLNTIEAGVLTIDVDGLVIAANNEATRLLDSGLGCVVGAVAEEILPPDVCQASLAENAVRTFGRTRHGGRSIQWRAKWLADGLDRRGTVIVLWEDVECQ